MPQPASAATQRAADPAAQHAAAVVSTRFWSPQYIWDFIDFVRHVYAKAVVLHCLIRNLPSELDSAVPQTITVTPEGNVAIQRMRIADAFLDLVSSETTLRENNLKEIEGGTVLESQVTANMKGSSAEEVAGRVLSQPSLYGLQGPTISPIFWKWDGKVTAEYYAKVICVPKKALYKSIQ
ncbi:ATP phosphoribosyltransferase 2 [Arachis hypogaea]|nr:ATP phosphoribosyltransferase 2 [Arachis hypogaea]